MEDYRIRPAEPDDAKGLYALRIMPGILEGIYAIPSEGLENTKKFLQGLTDHDHMLCAVTDDGLIIGSICLSVSPIQRRRHCGTFGIMVHTDYQHQGVGTALMRKLIDVADNWLMLKRIELTVFSKNTAAIKLYESFGFEAEGIKRASAVQHGTYVDELIMARIR